MVVLRNVKAWLRIFVFVLNVKLPELYRKICYSCSSKKFSKVRFTTNTLFKSCNLRSLKAIDFIVSIYFVIYVLLKIKIRI